MAPAQYLFYIPEREEEGRTNIKPPTQYSQSIIPPKTPALLSACFFCQLSKCFYGERVRIVTIQRFSQWVFTQTDELCALSLMNLARPFISFAQGDEHSQGDSQIRFCERVLCLIITFMGKHLVSISNLCICSYMWSQYLFLKEIFSCAQFLFYIFQRCLTWAHHTAMPFSYQSWYPLCIVPWAEQEPPQNAQESF